MFANFHCHRCATQVHHACLVQEELHTLWRRLVLDSRSHYKKYVLTPVSLSPKYMTSLYFSRMLQAFSVSSFVYRYLRLLAFLFACPISFDVCLSSADPKIFRLWSFTGTRNCTSTSTKTSVFDPHHDVMGFRVVFFTIVHFSFFMTLAKNDEKCVGVFCCCFFCFPTFPPFSNVLFILAAFTELADHAFTNNWWSTFSSEDRNVSMLASKTLATGLA